MGGREDEKPRERVWMWLKIKLKLINSDPSSTSDWFLLRRGDRFSTNPTAQISIVQFFNVEFFALVVKHASFPGFREMLI